MPSFEKLPKILVIVGPTASGKTALVTKLAKKLNGEVVSADSRQIYRGMDIGTAKPPRDGSWVTSHGSRVRSNIKNQISKIYHSEGIPHHLIDIKNPDEDYTVADYKRDAVRAIKKILAKGKLPILVGGTGLYVKAVVENLDIPKVKENPQLRLELEAELGERGLDALFKKLLALDPKAAYIVDPKNPRRVIRALEVAITTGKPFTAQRKKKKPLFDACVIGINTPPETLKKRIESRVDEMIKSGFVEEVKNLYSKYGKAKAFEAIGYREIIEYLEYCRPRESGNPEHKKMVSRFPAFAWLWTGRHGNDKKMQTLVEAIAQIKVNTWHYAKRQMTWFRKDRNILWI